MVDNHFFEILPPAEAKTKSRFINSSLVVFFVTNSSSFQIIFFPSDRSDESNTNSDIGKSRCSRIFSNSDPTAPEEPKTATFNGLLGKYGDCLTL